MDGSTYHPGSTFNSHVRRTFGLKRATIFVPGGAKGVAEKLNSLKYMCMQKVFGLESAVRGRLSVILACSISLSHLVRRKFRSILASLDLR